MTGWLSRVSCTRARRLELNLESLTLLREIY